MLDRILVVLAVALAPVACASFPPPTDTLASSLASVRGAEELGADKLPRAALQLQLAREEIAKARQLMAAGDHERAHFMALRASNDAELAIAMVRENNARNTALISKQQVDAAREMTP
jgi:hypothetical protein